MNKNTLKVIKILALFLVVIAFYYSGQIVSVDQKRVEATFDNLKNSESFQFSGDLVLEGGRGSFYDLSFDGYYKNNKVSGDFILETRIDEKNEEVEGRFLYDFENLYVSLNENKLASAFKNIFEEDEDLLEEKWIKTALSFFDSYQIKEIESYEKVEEAGFHFKVLLDDFLIFRDLEVQLISGKEDLYLSNLFIEQEVELTKDFYLGELVPSFSEGSSVFLNLKLNLEKFNDNFEEIVIPEL